MALSAEDRQELRADPAAFVRRKITDFVLNDPAGRLASRDGYTMYDAPLVRFADGDDPIFEEYKDIIAPVHLTPREALALAYDKEPEELPARISVISWILPITEETRRSNYAETRGPGRLWAMTRWYGELFNDAVRRYVADTLAGAGYLAVAPFLQPYFKGFENEKGMYSNWSERHVAYAAGQGTFSLSDGFITERGIAHRCGSVVTDLVLPVDARTAAGPYANCLAKRGLECGKCIARCPAGAITPEGHDKIKCGEYMLGLGYDPKRFKQQGFDDATDVAGCGLCQTDVPCEYLNPARKLKD
jgi:ferredoxin